MIIHGTITKQRQSMTIKIVNVHLRPPLAMGDDAGGVMGNMNVFFLKAGSLCFISE